LTHAARSPDKAEPPHANPNISPLAQDYVVVAQTPNRHSQYIHDPGMTRLDNGHLFVAAPARTFYWKKDKNFTFLSRSVDGGRSWESLGTVPFADATALVHESSLYLMGQYQQGKDWFVMRSNDEGSTWTEPVQVIQGMAWNCQTSMVRRDHHLYWAMGSEPHFLWSVSAVRATCDAG
jgi:hypothetical protein